MKTFLYFLHHFSSLNQFLKMKLYLAIISVWKNIVLIFASLHFTIHQMLLSVLHKSAVGMIPTQTINRLLRDADDGIHIAGEYKWTATLLPRGIIKPQSTA